MDNIVIDLLSSIRFVALITVIIVSTVLVSLWRRTRDRQTWLFERSKSNEAYIRAEAGQIDVPRQPLRKCSSQANSMDCGG